MVWKVEVTTFSMLLRMPSNWLKIPKSVIVTDFPLSSLKYLMYLAEKCCDSKMCFWPMDIPGWDPVVFFVVGTFSLPWLASFPVRIPVQSSVLSTNDTVTSSVLCDGWWLWWWARLQVHLQPADITSCASFENVLNLRCFLLFFVFKRSLRPYLSEFPCLFRDFWNYSQYSLSENRTYSNMIFLMPNRNFREDSWCSLISFCVPFLMFHRTTARPREARRSLW